MSDSDDTDILLLIPPNFFLTTTLAAEAKSISKCKPLKDSENYINGTINDQNNSINSLAMNSQAEQYVSKGAEALPPTYQFLPPSKQLELNNINERLSAFEHEANPSNNFSSMSNFIKPPEIKESYKYPQPNRFSLAHSTPKEKQQLEFSELNGNSADNGVLHEIDDFLHEQNYVSFSNVNGRQNENNEAIVSLPNSLSSTAANLNNKYDKNFSEQNAIQMRNEESEQQQDTLISLDEIWGKNVCKSSLTLKEEQYRRLHLEKTVRQLQGHLLEYQQRLSVAIEVDRSKDSALSNFHAENKRLNQEVCIMRESIFRLETELNGFNQKQETTQKELAHALGLVAKYQDKNEKLENEMINVSRNSNKHSKQIEDLETCISSYKKSEEMSIAEINKLKEKLAKAEYNEEKAIKQRNQCEKEFETLKHQKDLLQEFHQKQKNRAELLENQKKLLQKTVSDLTEKESTLERKLETQKQALKSHYQQQLENVVSQKLLEFQEQLDKVEESLKTEARDRERLIADRAIKQLELINEKNDLELKLIQEKHNEEIELYRIQLANASCKIEELEKKLNAYKSKRADLAEKLHTIMETQWQKALEVLTSPHPPHRNSNLNDGEKMDGAIGVDQSDSQNTAENEMFETPNKSRSKKNKTDKQDDGLTTTGNLTEPHVDKLRAYIELLLRKSPTDFDRLDEILAQSKPKVDKSGKRSSISKPPWKS